MRFLAVFLLIGALLGAACEAPARAPASASMPAPPPSGPPGSLRDRPWPQEVLPLPAQLPDEGIDPAEAAARRLEDVWVVGTGTVERLLRDDTKRPRHQRFIVRAPGGSPTMLFAHNIDLAPRVPVKRGDLVAFRGEYVWNRQGGVVHWTHRDRRDRKAGGWIVWKGQTFR